MGALYALSLAQNSIVSFRYFSRQRNSQNRSQTNFSWVQIIKVEGAKDLSKYCIVVSMKFHQFCSRTAKRRESYLFMLYLKATNRPLLFPLPIVERILEIPPDDKVDRVSKYPTNKYQSLLAYQRKVSCEHISTLNAEDTAALRHVCSLDLQYVQPIIHFQTYFNGLTFWMREHTN